MCIKTRGAPPDRTGITLHESGYLPDNSDWNFPSVFSPFWRLYHNQRPGHCVLFGDEMTELTRDRMVLIPPHQYFHCLGQNPVPTCWLAFSFTGRLDESHYPVVGLRPRATEISLIRSLCRLIEANETWAPTAPILHHSMALLHVVLGRPELQWRELRVTSRLYKRHAAHSAGSQRCGLRKGCFDGALALGRTASQEVHPNIVLYIW